MDNFINNGFNLIQLGFFSMLFAACGFGVGFGIYATIASARSDGKVDYCRVISRDNYTYYLEGHRNWRDDINLGTFSSFQSAQEVAEKRNCPVK